MANASIHFRKANRHNPFHNDRADSPNYLLPEKHRKPNECNLTGRQTVKFEDELYNSASSLGTTRRAERSNTVWEGVINLNAEHSLADVQKLAGEIGKFLNITPTQISVHRDEGHIDKETGEVKYNYHAHVRFFTLCRRTGKQMWRREHITRKRLTLVQDMVAERLGMVRGQASDTKHLDPKQYRKRAQSDVERKKLAEEVETLKSENERLKLKLERLNAERERIKTLELTAEAKKEEYRRVDAERKEVKSKLKNLPGLKLL